MKRLPFERPTNYYDERLLSIDEQICSLIKQRKEISNNNPGFPPPEYISNWAKSFDLYEDLLNSLFGSLINDEHFRPYVEPKGFIKHLPVLKAVEKGEYVYSVTFFRQYENASVVYLNIDWDETADSLEDRHFHNYLDLFLGESYDCRMGGGGGSTGHYTHTYIVSPPLPDDLSGLDFIFREYKRPFDDPTGLEIVMHME